MPITAYKLVEYLVNIHLMLFEQIQVAINVHFMVFKAKEYRNFSNSVLGLASKASTWNQRIP